MIAAATGAAVFFALTLCWTAFALSAVSPLEVCSDYSGVRNRNTPICRAILAAISPHPVPCGSPSILIAMITMVDSLAGDGQAARSLGSTAGVWGAFISPGKQFTCVP
jgi:hypothetical protein